MDGGFIMTRKYTHCKHCNNELGEWQAPNAESCQDTECIKDVRVARNKLAYEKVKQANKLLVKKSVTKERRDVQAIKICQDCPTEFKTRCTGHQRQVRCDSCQADYVKSNARRHARRQRKAKLRTELLKRNGAF